VSTHPRPRKTPSHAAIVRAVASSTAIETGQRIAAIEAKLHNVKNRVSHFSLALNRPAQSAQG
jgi:F0F1-type ATP synthase gamma subunit